MINLILMLSLKCLGDGARISMSKWKKSHQKALELFVVCDARIAVMNRSRIDSNVAMLNGSGEGYYCSCP